ncbi:MAG: hypothetical protein U0Q21_13030 [Dermatophilaceae bacterium]
MSTLERRLHLMIDQARYDQLTAEATRTGRSVADIVRSAIDLHFDEDRDQARRAAAARFLLASADSDSEPGETWEEMLAIQEAELDRRLDLA